MQSIKTKNDNKSANKVEGRPSLVRMQSHVSGFSNLSANQAQDIPEERDFTLETNQDDDFGADGQQAIAKAEATNILSKEDLANIARARRQSLKAAELDFDALDLNKNGVIDRNEIMNLAL